MNIEGCAPTTYPAQRNGQPRFKFELVLVSWGVDSPCVLSSSPVQFYPAQPGHHLASTRPTGYLGGLCRQETGEPHYDGRTSHGFADGGRAVVMYEKSKPSSCHDPIGSHTAG